MTDAIRVLLVDDQELIRVGFRMVLDAEEDIVVVGEAGDGKAAITQTALLAPDLVLMDIRMPELDGIAATEAIVRDHPQTKVLVLTTFDLDEYAFGAIRAGASGFLLKDAQRHEMISAVRAVSRGDAALSPRVTRALMEHVTPDSARPLPPLRPPRRAPHSNRSPIASATCSSRSAAASPTRRSPRLSMSASPR